MKLALLSALFHIFQIREQIEKKWTSVSVSMQEGKKKSYDP